MKEIYLLGVGRNTPVFIDLAENSGYRVAGLYHYNESRTGEKVDGFMILGSFDDLYRLGDLSGMEFLLTMGDNIVRSCVGQKVRSYGGVTPPIIHPSAVVSRYANISQGVCISPFSYVQAHSEIGEDTIILSGVNVSHNNRIGSSCFIAGGVTIGAYTTVGDYVFIGQGTLTISGKVKNIGSGAYIGAGSLVTRAVDSNDLVVGRPARSIRTQHWRDAGKNNH